MPKKGDARLVVIKKEQEKEIRKQTQVTVPHLRLIHRRIEEKIFPEKS